MKRKLISLGFACIFGGLVGAVGINQLAEHFGSDDRFRMISVLMCSVALSIILNFGRLNSGIAHSWRSIVNWRSHRLYWHSVIAKEACGTAIMASLISLIVLIDSWCTWETFRTIAVWTLLLASTWVFFFMLSIPRSQTKDFLKHQVGLVRSDHEYEAQLREDIEFGWTGTLLFNPIVFPFFLGLSLWNERGLIWRMICGILHACGRLISRPFDKHEDP
ncbi:MAG TPA: hypothetical protein VF803_01570 [Candidatus Paceibacterota bacterium]